MNRVREINEAFVQWGVRSPYALLLGIKGESRVREFNAKAVVLLHQVNMLREVHQNKTVLGDGELAIHAKWASTILRPWIEADGDLKEAWLLSKEAEDLRDPQFAKWLNELLPIL